MDIKEKEINEQKETTKTKTTTKKSTPKKAKIDKEKEYLKKENQSMTEMLKMMQERMDELQSKIENKSQPNIQNNDITRTVKVTSLVGNTLTLSTMKNGDKNGRTYKFDKYGQTRSILFSDMQAILINHTRQFEKYKVILSSETDYINLGIGYIYNSKMMKKNIDKIIELKNEEDLDLIFSLNEDMQEKIVDLIAEKIVNGKSYDYNKIKELKDNGFDVEKIVEEMKNTPNRKE